MRQHERDFSAGAASINTDEPKMGQEEETSKFATKKKRRIRDASWSGSSLNPAVRVSSASWAGANFYIRAEWLMGRWVVRELNRP